MTGSADTASADWVAFSRLLNEALEREGADRDAWLTRLATTDPPMAERLTRALAVYAEDRFAALFLWLYLR